MNLLKAIRNGETRQFNPEAWRKLPSHKYGWKLVAEAPEEVKQLQSQFSPETGDAPNDLLPQVSSDGSTSNGDSTPMNAADTIKAILAAQTVEELDAILQPGEERKGVLKAFEKRKAELS